MNDIIEHNLYMLHSDLCRIPDHAILFLNLNIVLKISCYPQKYVMRYYILKVIINLLTSITKEIR